MNLTSLIKPEDLTRQNFKKIFFYRICGTGMGACACLAKEAGYHVAGADLSYSPPMSTYLESSGIELFSLDELSAEQLQAYDLIIVGNSVPRDSHYAQFVETSGVPFTSFPDFLGELVLKKRDVIGLAGTHGKTTTTFFLTQMLEFCGQNPGYFIGGIMNDRPPSSLGEGFFAIESDEYDSAYFQKISKFRLYKLDHMILTSLEFDHADIFNSIEDIKDEFRAILPEFKGRIVANDGYPAIAELRQEFPDKNWLFYGSQSEVGPFDIETSQGVTSFRLQFEDAITFETNMVGEHNILNISACIILMYQLGFKLDRLQKAVKALGLVKRRQEERGLYRGALVIDDFAHHPKAIELTLAGLRLRYPKRQLLVVFEPISATARSRIFQQEFEVALSTADSVILAMNPLPTTIGDGLNLDGEKMATQLQERGISSVAVNTLNDLRSEIDQRVNPDTLLVILSNRTCLGLWESDFVQALS